MPDVGLGIRVRGIHGKSRTLVKDGSKIMKNWFSSVNIVSIFVIIPIGTIAKKQTTLLIAYGTGPNH